MHRTVWIDRIATSAALLALLFAAAPLAAQAPDLLDAEVDGLSSNQEPARGSSGDSIASAQIGQTQLRLIDISLTADFAAGASSVGDEHLNNLQGNFHDPRQRGFQTTAAELGLVGAVDPYFRLESYINFAHGAELEEIFATSTSLPFGLQLEAGRFFTEFGIVNAQHPHQWSFEDAPVIHTRLMGRHGMNGDGVRLAWLLPTDWFSEFHVGAQNAKGANMLSFLGPREGGGHSHGGGPDSMIGGYEPVDRGTESSGDLVYLARWTNSFNLSDSTTARIGVSGLTGPNATGPRGVTHIYGADLYVKWRPTSNFRGFPYVVWQTEFMRRDYIVDKQPDIGRLENVFWILNGDFFPPYDEWEQFDNEVLNDLLNDSIRSDDLGNFGLAVDVFSGRRNFSALTEDESQRVIEATIRTSNPTETLHDWGYYSQITFGFRQGWSLGLRYEFASGQGESRVDGGEWIEDTDINGRDRDPMRDTRVRISPILTYQPTHFSRFRIQYNQERADHLRERRVFVFRLSDFNPTAPAIPFELPVQDQGRLAWSVWLGAEFLIGFHPAHEF